MKVENLTITLAMILEKKGRQGREAIDKANEVLEHSVSSSTQEDEKVVDSIDAVNKFFHAIKKNLSALS